MADPDECYRWSSNGCVCMSLYILGTIDSVHICCDGFCHSARFAKSVSYYWTKAVAFMRRVIYGRPM